MKNKTNKHYAEPEENNNNVTGGDDVTQDAEVVDGGKANVPDETYDPLISEDTIKRGHTNQTAGTGSNRPMAEAIVDPNIKLPAQEGSEGVTGGDQYTGGMPPDQSIPSYEDLKKEEEKMTDADRKDNALMTADLALDAYDGGWKMIGNWLMPISDNKIKKMVSEGRIALETPVAWENGHITMGQAIQMHNADSRDKLGLDDETKNKIRGIIANELSKRGMVMTPMMYVAVVLIRHTGLQIQVLAKHRDNTDRLIAALERTHAGNLQGRPPAGPHIQTPSFTPANETTGSAQTSGAKESDTDNTPAYVPADQRVVTAFDKIQKTNAAHRVTRKEKPLRKKTVRKKTVKPPAI